MLISDSTTESDCAVMLFLEDCVVLAAGLRTGCGELGRLKAAADARSTKTSHTVTDIADDARLVCEVPFKNTKPA